jgi:hypothetical protein
MTTKDKILSKSILHGRGVIAEILHGEGSEGIPEVKVSSEIKVVTVLDESANINACLKHSNIVDNTIEFIIISHPIMNNYQIIYYI